MGRAATALPRIGAGQTTVRADDTGARAGFAHQPALDGLRGLAVAGVVLFHAGLGWTAGGFLGVEVFFVLSGYLITSLLLEESSATGTVGLPRFWARRARRLLPALALLVVVVGCYQATAGSAHAVPHLLGDGLSTLFYVANWHQIWTGAGYFAATGPASPLQHTWSLAIEEQFYLVWPPVLLAVAALARRRRDPHRFRLRAVLGLALGGSVLSALLMAVLVGHGGIDRVYFGTDTRASGILAGAAAAVVAMHWRRGDWRVPRAVTATGSLGLGAVLAGFATVSGASGWLYRGGMFGVDVAVAALILAVAVGPGSLVARVLSPRPLRALGVISYGVYLWHFPLFLWLTEPSTGLSGASLLALRVAATLGAATFSYVLVEQPIRHRRLPRPVLAAAGVLGPAVALCSLLLAASVAAPAFAGARAPGSPPPVASAHPRTALLVGDSLGLTLGIGLGTGSSTSGVDVVDTAILGCGFTDTGQVLTGSGFLPQNLPCADAFATWHREYTALHPDAVVVVLGFWDCFTRQWGGAVVHVGQAAYDRYLASRIDLLVSDLGGGSVPIVLVGVPLTDAPPFPDGTPAPQNDPARHRSVNTMLRAAAARHQGVHYFDLDAVVSPGGHYTAFVAGSQCRWSDGEHFTIFCGRRTQRTLFPLLGTAPGTVMSAAR